MDAKKLRELERKLARMSHGKAMEYAVMIKGNHSVVFPAVDTAKFKRYLKDGYTHAMNVLDGNVMELF